MWQNRVLPSHILQRSRRKYYNGKMIVMILFRICYQNYEQCLSFGHFSRSKVAKYNICKTQRLLDHILSVAIFYVYAVRNFDLRGLECNVSLSWLNFFKATQSTG